MLRYVALKVGRALFVVWAAFTVSFVLLFVLPADPVDLLFDPAEVNTIPPEVREQVAANYGFDDPVLVQYADRLWHAARLDFGTSVQSGRPVTEAILGVLPATLVLAAGALALAVVIAFVIALVATATEARWLRDLVEALPSAAVSIPVFLSGILVLQVFSFQLGWFPAFGDEGWRSLVLPLVTLAIPVSGPIAQLLVRSFATELRSGYVTTSWAKGAERSQIIVGDVFRNAALPALTIAGVTFGNLIAGSVITETVFARKGIGRMTQTAINTLDVPLVQGIVVLVAVCFALINLAVDLVYPLLDPRLRATLADTPARVPA
ncbi:peptide/nickel transport system permease protein [Nocardioides zeae]|uniref:Peptide/nickel transport system permease protein n=2 Tax=Nocardioides zeae TaxID=1457234 RepID=A0ACC6INI8_9ACTN|nr:ABC transporter permease [Nocardioides zeae]MDQ1106567.1 peptide/nickel transport system permease protein [Nocardioides zeae]MDR6173753.1 peptide/nickel transport system permease protein [Nocardioides zeae]MDR6212217.1 peptide/nickel transport system permease protein [Nocardioides zeae]